MHTFFDEVDPDSVDKNRQEQRKADTAMLDVWKAEWAEAGFEPHILTLKDAERHPKYNEYIEKLKDVNLVGKGGTQGRYNELCFIRWLAMASVGGGYMSDYDVLPVKDADSIARIALHNKFTVFDQVPGRGGIPSLMAGEEEEWLRMSFEILNFALSSDTPHEDFPAWSDFYSLLLLYKANPGSYTLVNAVGRPRVMLSHGFNEKTCEEAEPFVALHFSHADMEVSGTKVTDRHKVGKELVEQIRTNCESTKELERPSVYTFFEDMDPKNQDANREELRRIDTALLDEWKNAWHNAGFEPRILTLNDAKRHPLYDEFMSKLGHVKMIGEGTPQGRFNEFCFLRWLAMASVGGGLLSDYDVYPIKDASTILPLTTSAEDQFTVFDEVPDWGGIPSLMFGNPDQWIRMAFAVVDVAQKEPLEKYNGWSDFLALLELNKKHPESYRINDLVGEVEKLLKFPMRQSSCKSVKGYIALHFSLNDTNKSQHSRRDRPELARKALEFVAEHCTKRKKRLFF